MAQRKEESYVFDVSAKTVKVPGHVEERNLIMITNATTNQIIYNQFDPTKNALRSHEHIWQGDPNFPDPEFPWSIDGTCTFTLDADLSGMTDTDQLSILVDDYRSGTKFRPYDHGLDAVERMRVSNPESRIDTDFEYGLQDTKWETVGYNRNHATFYELDAPPLTVTSLTSDGATPSTITGVLSGGGPAAGEPISVKGSTSSNADGTFLAITASGGTNFTYVATGNVPSGDITTSYIEVKKAGEFSNATLPVISTITGDGNGASDTPGLVTITFLQSHGLFPGSPLEIYDGTTGKQVHEGNFFVKQVITDKQLTYETPPNTSAVTNGSISTANGITAYARQDGFAIHRPFDGGVNMGTREPLHGLKMVRQTKEYFRYQSGKGTFWSTAIAFNPTFEITNVTYDSGAGEIEITTREEHGLQDGAKVFLEGIASANYYGEYDVKEITGSNTFKCDALATPPTETPAKFSTNINGVSDEPRIVVTQWSGSTLRAGIFDDQNGMFWEYDGRNLCVVRRSGTTRLAGTVSIANHTITGTNTRFTEQLKVDDRIIVRGVTYIVTTIVSDTTLTIASGVRSNSTITDAFISKVEEIRICQEDFNYDTINGQGQSGFLFRPRYTQMVGINYSWYGSGFIDFMIRGPLGEWIKAHRMPNHNIYSKAYLRSGNLPARYEVNNVGGVAQISNGGTALAAAATTIPITDATFFPTPNGSGPEYAVILSDDAGTQKQEVISYTGKSGNSLTGVTRRTSFSQVLNGLTYDDAGALGTFSSFSGSTDSWDHADGSGIVLLNTTFAPRLAHWGCSLITDGGFDEGKAYLFSFKRTGITVSASSSSTVLLFRLCPSVSNTIPGNFGDRELINREQCSLDSIEVVNVNGRETEITGILNPTNIGAANYQRTSQQTIGGANLNQKSYTEAATSGGLLTSGVPENGTLAFTYFSDTTGTKTLDLSDLKNIENSVQGGQNVYPDGPEVLAIYITNLDTGNSGDYDVVLRWKEAGA